MLRSLARRGLRKGMIEGSRPWLWVGIGASALTLVRRLLREEPETVFREPLLPGEKLVIEVRGSSDE